MNNRLKFFEHGDAETFRAGQARLRRQYERKEG